MSGVKEGDRIRVLTGRWTHEHKGEMATVRCVKEDGSVTARVDKGDDFAWFFGREDYEAPAEAPAQGDNVRRPHHYARFAIEPITFITANKLGFLPGNVIKYVLRHDAKNGIEDLRKAARYLEIMIEDAKRIARGETLKMDPV